MFENFNLQRDKDSNLFIVMCRDREVQNGERWVVITLTNEDVRQIYEYLKEYFQKEVV